MIDTSSLKSDFRLSTKAEVKITKREDKDECIINNLFKVIIIFPVFAAAIMVYYIQDFRHEIKEKYPNYNFPNYSDMKLIVIPFIILIVNFNFNFTIYLVK